jgi:hypothetical protein
MPSSNKIKSLINYSEKYRNNGIILGLAVGTGIGAAIGNIALWAAIGLAAGCSFSSASKKNTDFHGYSYSRI